MSALPTPGIWDRPAIRTALREHDIGAVYRILIAEGMTQQALGRATGQAQSEVSEILGGRRVMAYGVLLRIAQGLHIPLGYMGLAYDESIAASTPPNEEVDEDMKRRALLAAGGIAALGIPITATADPAAPTVRDVILNPPSRISMKDVMSYEHVVARLGVLDRESGGMAAREGLAATAHSGEKLLAAQCGEDVRRRMQGAVSEAHRLAGWASGDIGLIDQCRWHMHRAMDHAGGDPQRLAGVLASAGDMEKHYGAPDDALKFFQLGLAGLPPDADPQSGAVLHGLAAGAYLKTGHQEQARKSLVTSRAMFADAPDPEASLPFFAFYGPGHGLLAATGSKLAQYENARTDVRRALDARPDYDVRCHALDTIVLSTILVDAGELRDGIEETRRALQLTTTVGSQRVRDRLEPLEQVLSRRKNSTCQDLARQVHTFRMPTAL